MIGSKRYDSSTIRATPSASGEARSKRNFSINSSARSGEDPRDGWGAGVGAAAVVASEVIWAAPGPFSRRLSRETPRARQIRLKVPACGLVVLPRSI